MLVPAIVTTADELRQILALQQLYLRGKNNLLEEREQGFLTVHHSYEVLHYMHKCYPSVIVKDSSKIVAYALMMPREARNLVPALEPMFNTLDKITYLNKPLPELSYYVMGQICVAKEYRGKGLVEMLYRKHKAIYQQQFDFIITEISGANRRSLRAHEKVGFKTISTHKEETDEWHVVLWDWK